MIVALLLLSTMFLMLSIDCYKKEQYRKHEFFQTVGLVLMAIVLLSASFMLLEVIK
ncbi:hypothetical protein [Staphylococcus shinii]|uniref:hypothetical protein n=1 Tax=Staphylococcus shinii TaxID=2912228 RepID=UPI003F543C97